ncbi:MAG: hypothetical protein OEZ59_13035, partial [Deltaproteobacteria bacterium]|nr:hypothetical protein [Deltaproteobacteria bacterium]
LPEKIKSHQVEPGETAFECLERAARMRGALLISTGAGAVEITRAGTDSIDTVLERGVNILAARGQLSHRDRFSEYTVLGQAAGDDSGFGVVASEPKGTAQDAGVSRTRPLTVLSESPGGLADMKTRAEWERAVRLGRSSQVVITVQGWEHSGGLWEPNTRVKVRDDWLGLDEELLLAGVSLVLDDNGSRAELTLTRPEAFDLLPVPEPYEGSSWE